MPTDVTTSDADLPSQGVRTFVTLAIIVHLVAITVALGAYTEPSRLLIVLKKVFAPYTRTLKFDVVGRYYSGARWHLTHASETDVDFAVEVDAELPGGKTEAVILPPSVRPGIRWRRYQTLANAAGSVAANDELQSILARSIAASALENLDAHRGTVTVRGHYLPSLKDFNSMDPARSNPMDKMYFANLYEAQVFAQAGQVELLKKSSAAEVAPRTSGGRSR